jgi:monovalent cation:H+ antiporter-2, CPA2 family
MDSTGPAILELGLVLLAAVGAGWVARRIGLPAVVGYLALGLAVSPFTPGYVADRERLQLLADLGVVLLLFEVGIEFDPIQLRRGQRSLLAAVPLQVLLGMAISGGAFALLGLAPIPAATMGLCVALSSSVVVANVTRSVRRRTDPPTEAALLGWSLIQDLVAVVVAAVLLAALQADSRGVPLALAGLVAFAAVALLVARLMPPTLRALTAYHDLFLIVSVASGFVLAGLGSVLFGVPLALAAFVGGLAIAESPESAEARLRILPFRDLLAVLFFVAIGSLIDPAALARGAGWVAVLLGLILVAKVLPIWALARVSGLGARPSQVAIGLGQVGEFSFVLASELAAADLISLELYSAALATVALTIAGSSVLVRMVPRGISAESGRPPSPSLPGREPGPDPAVAHDRAVAHDPAGRPTS